MTWIIWDPKASLIVGISSLPYNETSKIPDGCEVREVEGSHPGGWVKLDEATNTLVPDDEREAIEEKRLLEAKLAVLETEKAAVEVRLDELADVVVPALADLAAFKDGKR